MMRQGSVRLDEATWERVIAYQKRLADKGPRNASLNDALAVIVETGLRDLERKR